MGWGLIPSWETERKAFGSGVGKIWKNINNIWDQLNVEVKNHNVTAAGAISSTPLLTSNFMNIAAGISGSSSGTGIDVGYRDGDKIRMKSFHLKGHLDGGTVATEFNVIIFKHFDNFLGNTPTFEDLYHNASNPSNYSSQFRNLDKKGQFRILARRQIRLSGVQDKDNDKNFDIYIPFRTKKNSYVEWEGTQGTDPSNGKLHMFTWCTNTTGTPTISWSSRTSYIDN